MICFPTILFNITNKLTQELRIRTVIKRCVDSSQVIKKLYLKSLPTKKQERNYFIRGLLIKGGDLIK